MSELTNGDIALACMSLLVDELARAGITHACIAPGSRSAPLVLALARHGGMHIDVVLDERSAGFFALGIAKQSGRAVVVACTSGTAAANLFPAIVEASLARVPLIAMTADRPPELRDTGANQTIDQVKLFGEYPRLFVDCAVPEMRPGAGRYWRSVGARAVAVATGALAGPVHLNLPFREPLVPSGSVVTLDGSDAPNGAWERSFAASDRVEDWSHLAGEVAASERGVIIAGGMSEGADIASLAESLGWPMVAEPMSGARVPGRALEAPQAVICDHAFAQSHVPDVAIRFGDPPTSRATAELFARSRARIVVDPDPRRGDPDRAHGTIVHADPARAARGLLDQRDPVPRAARGLLDQRDPVPRAAWGRDWARADAAARAAIDGVLDNESTLFEPRVARHLAAAIPDGSALVVASSMPVRDLDAFMVPRSGLRVLANRGASGIDGFTSTVLGVARAGTHAVALCGDLSFLHDIGALAWCARAGITATIVVVNNNGGGIFDLLPQRTLAEHERFFVTSHAVDIEALVRASGAQYLRAKDSADIARAVSNQGLTVCEVAVDRARSIAHREEIARAASDAIAGAIEAS